jgi:glutamate synthase (NADPH/NADH) large chain/glutamate synthase (ferredoxin)
VCWRDVPVEKDYVGITANWFAPYIKQLVVAASPELAGDQDAFERKLYVIRRVAEKAAGPDLVVPSFSSRTIVYKGMLTAPQLMGYYPDLQDARTKTALALVHSRFSTNTFPSWELAHPYRMIAHNGEINTLRGNVNWMRARESQLASELFGDDLQKVLPVVRPGGSDSATFDNVLELLVLAGRSLPHAVMMMVPEAWERRDELPDHLKAFYAFHSCVMEPWDGPAAVAFTDGRVIGATLDRNGLRPGRWMETRDGWVVLGSETGVLDEPADNVLRKGRLQPGKLFLVDIAEGRIVADEEAKSAVATRRPYGEWYDQGVVRLEELPERRPIAPREPLRTRQLAFGYTQEDLRVLLAPMAAKGEEPIGSMGNDLALAVFSDQAPPLFAYFKQLFAQVTNPPIDPIREDVVMSIRTAVGSERNLLAESAEHAHQLVIPHPILRNVELESLRGVDSSVFRSHTVPITWPVADGPEGMARAVRRICDHASEAIAFGANILVLSDRGVSAKRAAIPSLLAVAAVHHHLVREGTRLQAGLVLESGEPREVHHFATLISYGASAINPYLMLESLQDAVPADGREAADGDAGEAAKRRDKAERNVVKAIGKGLLKTISKMGISTIQSYNGAQIFEAVGLHRDLVDEHFTGTASRIGGIGIDVIARETLHRHALAYPETATLLPVGGRYAWRRDGEAHQWSPATVAKLQHAVRHGGRQTYDEWAREVNEQATRRCSLRGLLGLKFDPDGGIPLDEVEPASELVKRFATGAMSLGSLSREAHESLAIAMNRIHGRSNTGEGGEDPARYVRDPNGDYRRSAIKQVASGRFGVNIHYLTNADELQIKMAQGAKPGEGGQLPGHKVDRYIGKIRFTTPGVGLISPPPHHDIYSIEDLKQLIYDLRCANPGARVSVKLVAEVGVGTVAAGVAKANADHILISGHDGGTGASPLSSIQAAGLPWEIGLAETQQTLVMNDLRSRVWVQTDGQMKTGRDVVVAALLGADEVGFSTAPLIAMGCIMMRACHLNTCPGGHRDAGSRAAAALRGHPGACRQLPVHGGGGGARADGEARRRHVRRAHRPRRVARGGARRRSLEGARGRPLAPAGGARRAPGRAAPALSAAALPAARRARLGPHRCGPRGDRPQASRHGRVRRAQREPHRRRAALALGGQGARRGRAAAGDHPLHAARLGRAVVRRVAGAGRRARPDRRRERLHRQGPVGRRGVRPAAGGRHVRRRGERHRRQHGALRRHERPRVLPRPRGRALRGAQLGRGGRRGGHRRPRLRVHDRRADRRAGPDRAQLRGRHERRRRLRARRGRDLRAPVQHGARRFRCDGRERRDGAPRPHRGAPPAHAVAGRGADPGRVGDDAAALQEGHAARLQAGARGDGRGRAGDERAAGGGRRGRPGRRPAHGDREPGVGAAAADSRVRQPVASLTWSSSSS